MAPQKKITTRTATVEVTRCNDCPFASIYEYDGTGGPGGSQIHCLKVHGSIGGRGRLVHFAFGARAADLKSVSIPSWCPLPKQQ